MTPSTASIAPLDPADKRASTPHKKICVRCRQQKSSVILQTATYCHECFQINFEAKIRQNLEQGRLCTYLHRNEASSSSSKYPCKGRVSIGFSGGVASRTLLHIARERLSTAQRDIRSGKTQEIHAIDVVYVDTSAVIEDAQDETETVRQMVQEEGGEAEGIYFWPLKLHDVFDDDQMAQCRSESASVRYLSTNSIEPTSKEAALRSLFESIQPKDTPKGAQSNARSRAEDLIGLLTTHLLRRQAIKQQATCLMTGETSTRAAIRLIDAVGKGRGHKLSVEEGSIRWNGLFILRPMKAVTAKQVVLYSRGKKLSSLPPSEIIAMQLLSGGSVQEGGNGNKASMARLTESLIHLLEKNVPSTVSTINKVGDKLVFSDDLATHGYQDDDDNDLIGGGRENRVDANASSSTAFHQIGPSVPLRHRKRQDSTSTQLSRMSIASNGPIPGGPGDRSLQGLGLGRMGSTFYYAAKNMLVYNGILACPLCQMPSQRGLHDWKRGLTIKSDQSQEATSQSTNQINLTDLLCYACTMVLDTPESIKEKTKVMVLPTFVLDGAKRRIMEVEGKLSLSQDDITAAGSILNGSSSSNLSNGNGVINTKSPNQHQTPVALQKLNQEQMKHHLNGFLLNDEDTTITQKNQKPTATQQRKQTDW